jgi:hypothetical protein
LPPETRVQSGEAAQRPARNEDFPIMPASFLRPFASGLAAAFLLSLALPAGAQTANPLQPRSTPAATQAKQKPATTQETAEEKPKRQRSAAQLANDERLRKCGAEWRANKAKLTSQGYNWIKYSTECRARLKAAGQ